MDDFDGETSTRNPVFCTLVNATLDLDREDLGHPGHPGLWERLLGDRRPVDQRGLHCPDCLSTRGISAWMYVFERRGVRVAAHHHPPHHRHHRESDEHKAYKERYVRAAESAGHRAEVEALGPDGRRRTDVLVTGADGMRYGFAPQLSYITAATARQRDAADRADGITPVWHTVQPNSPLIDAVHWTRTDDLPAAAIRDDRHLLVRGGVRALALEQCDRMPTPCPVRRHGSCGRRHPRWDPRPRQFDALVRDIASGAYLPLTLKAGRGLRRFWAPAGDLDAFLACTADPGAPPRGRTTGSRPRRRGQCVVDRAERHGRRFEAPPTLPPAAEPPRPIARPPLAPVVPHVCSAGHGARCGAPARPYAGGWFCDDHRPGTKPA
ncbi:hypothetical protein ABT093_25670 [Kitasatospora sp. NPDC002551]|uniref:competence protein CoiA family protein n=1 Tax=unclassified Kitasatospora TaxID=2633591 RepID=UPI003330B418